MNDRLILVVDDHLANLKLACDVLEWSGYRVSKAADAEEALREVEQSPPDLILMDIGLPGTDGLSLTQRLKSGEATRHIPIVALTASAMKGDDQRMLAAGCDGYISKPIDTRVFASQVAQYLNGSKES
jgi:CheY-like chemotaxis protein